MYFNHDDNRILMAFLAVSLLVHLLVIFLVPEMSLKKEDRKNEPVYVEVRTENIENVDKEKKKIKFIDTENVKKTESKQGELKDKKIIRLGESDQIVPKEIAPKGDAIEDTAPLENKLQNETASTPTNLPTTKDGDFKVPTNLNIDNILNLPKTTTDRLENEWRFKYREEVEEGNAIWLDSRSTKYFSFMHRLRRGLQYAWEFPRKSIELREHGSCLIKMIFNRDGSVNDVELLESSGYPRLDRAAIAAVYKGAPYGQLPKVHDKNTLSILAFFSYELIDGPSVN